jgi:hypothetical protein
MTVRVILLLKRKVGMTRDEFKDAYEHRHRRLGMERVGHLLTNYRRHYLGPGSTFAAAAPVPTGNQPSAEVPFDVVTEMEFADRAALEECNHIVGEPATRAMFSADEETLFDRANCWTILTDETLVEDLKPYGNPRARSANHSA